MSSLQLCEECSRYHHPLVINQMPAAYCQNTIHQQIDNRPLYKPQNNQKNGVEWGRKIKWGAGILGSMQGHTIKQRRVVCKSIDGSKVDYREEMNMDVIGEELMVRDISNISHRSIDCRIDCSIDCRIDCSIDCSIEKKSSRNSATKLSSEGTNILRQTKLQNKQKNNLNYTKSKVILATIHQENAETESSSHPSRLTSHHQSLQYSITNTPNNTNLLSKGIYIQQSSTQQAKPYVLAGLSRFKEQPQYENPNQLLCCCYY